MWPYSLMGIIAMQGVNKWNKATLLSIFISGLLLGITGYSVYTAFGPTSKTLRDPFEEHED